MSDLLINLAQMPNLSEIYRKLRRGYHFCNVDGELFSELVANEAEYANLFDKLGYALERNAGDSLEYFYLRQPDGNKLAGDGTEDRASTILRIVLLISAMFDSAGTNASADNTRMADIMSGITSVEKSFFESVFDDSVAAERIERYGIDRDNVQKIVKQMVMFNMLREEVNGTMRFLAPIQRIQALSVKVLEQLQRIKQVNHIEVV